MGEHPEFGAQEPDDGVEAALEPGHGGTQQPERADPGGVLEADLDRDPTAHRVADDVGPVDRELVHQPEHAVGVPARVVAARGRLAGGAETGQIGRVDAVAGAERGGGLEQRGPGAAEAVQEQDVGARAHRQGRDPVPADVDVVDPQQRGAATDETEHPLERDGEIEVAADREQALLEGVDAGQLAPAQSHPRVGVGGDVDVGLAAGQALADAGAMWGAADLPAAPDVAQADVVGGVELRPRPRGTARGVTGRPSRCARAARRDRGGRSRRAPYRALPADEPVDARVSRTLRQLRIHDTATGAVRAVEPADGRRVRIYACGPTVYARIHVGNARPFVVFSLLKRFLVHEGYEVTMVANVTDINDKIYAAARAAGVPERTAGAGDDRGLHRATRRRSGARSARPRAAGGRDDHGDRRS